MWKIGAVSPIHTAGLKTSVTNNRPVTLLNVIRKVFEKCAQNKVFTALDATGTNEVTSLHTDFVKSI